jgi:diaminopimelate decarboxylase
VRTKAGQDRRFVIVDAGMNDLIRPALYGARHTIEVVAPRGADTTRVDVVGPVCESADTFAKDVSLPTVGAGELLAFRGAGAYGFVMASTYNGRPRPAEVLVDGERALCVRRRETLAELWRGEIRLDGEALDDSIPKMLQEDP